jgi:hypothetical protein
MITLSHSRCTGALCRTVRDLCDQVARKVEQHRQRGAKLDKDLEGAAHARLEIQEAARHQQVSGRGDREKFGKPFDCPQNNRLPQLGHTRNPLLSAILSFIVVYGAGSCKVRRAGEIGE